LKSFESTTEWADLIAALGKLGKVWIFFNSWNWLIIDMGKRQDEGFLYLSVFFWVGFWVVF